MNDELSRSSALTAGYAARKGNMETLGDALPREQERVRGVLAIYKRLGPPGEFGAAMIELELKRADIAMMSGDIVAMIKSYKSLKEIEA